MKNLEALSNFDELNSQQLHLIVGGYQVEPPKKKKKKKRKKKGKSSTKGDVYSSATSDTMKNDSFS